MSILSRFRTKWGKKHFEILVKTLEYGYATRKMGLMYNGNLPEDKTNVLEGFADSSLSLPRSQGCRTVVMNNAAVSFTSKRHTTTDDSTAAAELTEQYLCACDVEGYRNVMQEMGLWDRARAGDLRVVRRLARSLRRLPDGSFGGLSYVSHPVWLAAGPWPLAAGQL